MKRLIPLEVVESKILLIRGHKVLLDRDLARLYDVETRVLNQAVKRNIEHFPDDFIIVLARDEIMRISQIVISSDLKFSKSVMSFTEEGVAMLSGILRSQRAIQVNIAIMRTFVKLRRLMNSHADLCRKEGISPNIYYIWAKDFMEAGKGKAIAVMIFAVTSKSCITLLND